MIAFTVIILIRLAVPVASNGWIPSGIFGRILMILLLPIHTILMPVLVYRTYKAKSEASNKKLMATFGVCLLMLLVINPGDWFRLAEAKSKMLSVEEQSALYDDFLAELDTADLQVISIRTTDYEEGYSYSTTRDFEITEEMRHQILAILKEASVQPHDKEKASMSFKYGGAISLSIKANEYWGYFSYDYDNRAEEFGVKGQTRLSLYSPGTKPWDFKIDNSCVDRIVALIPDFYIDYSECVTESEAQVQLALYKQFLSDFSSAYVRDIEISVRQFDENWYDYVITEVLRDRVATILRDVPVVHYYYKRLEPYVGKTGIYQSISFDYERDGGAWYGYATLIYDYEAEYDSVIIPQTEGRALIHVYLEDKGEFYLVTDNQYMDKIFELLLEFEGSPR